MQAKRRKFHKLEYYRKLYGIEQIDMASFLGVAQSTYSQKENRRIAITFEEMEIIRERLNKEAKKSGDTYLSLEDIFLI